MSDWVNNIELSDDNTPWQDSIELPDDNVNWVDRIDLPGDEKKKKESYKEDVEGFRRRRIM